MIIFFIVVIVGRFARISFPDFTVNGTTLKMDEIIPTYVVTKFSVGIGLVIVVGLISAGLSTVLLFSICFETYIKFKKFSSFFKGGVASASAGKQKTRWFFNGFPIDVHVTNFRNLSVSKSDVMDQVTSFDWTRIFVGEQPLFFLAELFLRVVVIYIMALLLLRLAGKRSRQQLTTLELLLVIALGSAVGDVMFYPSVAIIYTIIVMLTILILQLLIEKLKTRFPRFDKFVDSKPTLIIQDGQFIEESLKSENLTKAEIYSSLRLEGIRNMGEVEYAYLEIPGQISVFKFEKGQERDGYVLVPYQEE